VCVDRQPTPTPVPPACVPAFQPGPDARANGAALQAAIDAAPDGGTVFLAPGVYEHLMDAPWQGGKIVPTAFFISRPLTIQRCGEGEAVLRRYGTSWSTLRIIDSGTVELVGLTIADAGTGGVLEISPGVDILHTTAAGAPLPDLTMRNCTVAGILGSGIACNADSGSGRIPLRIEDTAIRDNHGRHYAGGVYARGCTLDLRRVRIIDNTAGVTWSYDGTGGGIHLSDADADLRDCEVSGNTALYGYSGSPGHGGGIYVDGQSTLLVRAGSTVTGNTAAEASPWDPGLGGGVYVRTVTVPGPVVTIAAGTVFDNLPAVWQVCFDDGSGCS